MDKQYKVLSPTKVEKTSSITEVIDVDKLQMEITALQRQIDEKQAKIDEAVANGATLINPQPDPVQPVESVV